MVSFRLYWLLIQSRIRSQLQYRTSFALQVLSSFTATFVELLAMIFLFRTFNTLAGWTVGQVVFLYGLASTALSVAEIFAEGLEQTSVMIRNGEMDRLLIRPVRPLVQLLGTDLQLRKVGRASQGVFALVLAQIWAAPAWTLLKVFVFLGALGSTSLIFFSIFLIGATICFWTIERSEIQNAFTYGGTELASNPLQIYRRWLQMIFLLLVPLGLTVYYPAVYILGKPDPLGLPGFIPFLAPAVGALFLGVALVIWRFGLEHYQSTGN